MNRSEQKAAADLMLDKYIVEGKTEWSTRDYTAAVYPLSRQIVVSYMKKPNDEWPTQRVFDIATRAAK